MRELQRAALAAEDAVAGAQEAIRQAAAQAERLLDAALAAEHAAYGAGDSPDVAFDLVGQAENLVRILEDLSDDAINARRESLKVRRSAE